MANLWCKSVCEPSENHLTLLIFWWWGDLLFWFLFPFGKLWYISKVIVIDFVFWYKSICTRSTRKSNSSLFFHSKRAEASQRAKLMEGTQILNRTTESIARSHQISAETDQIGVETIDELGRQREVLVRTRDRVRLHEGDIKDETS